MVLQSQQSPSHWESPRFGLCFHASFWQIVSRAEVLLALVGRHHLVPFLQYLRQWEAYANDTLRSREDVDTDAAVPCPQSLNHGLNAHGIATTSSCPWINSETFDADRIPMVIQHARCLCDGCFDPRDGILQRDLTCSPIEINMDVLRKTETRNGYVRWSPTTERVSVGCACQIELMA
ncbi:putative interleukin 17-like protein [Apostichopus japonicus]|uniref:Putative interleukin 17-like protein n=1 Tax=Stichopus japonicus TaxID=307972 RepID=A0A2G8JGZ0_STIJA|nr:putative interleukin 17-like protein [Apostichopus japonicus]